MAAKKGQSPEDLPNASAQKSCCSIFNLAQKLKNYGKALACSLAASNIPVKIGLTQELKLLVAAYRLQRSAKHVLLAIERYDDRAFFKALERFEKAKHVLLAIERYYRTFFKSLERFKEARGNYFRLVALCEGSGNSDVISKQQVSEILGYHLIISLVDAWKTLRPLKEEYQASLETVSSLEKGQSSGTPRVCVDALRACLTLDVINGARDLARQLMTANFPLEEKLEFIEKVFPEIKEMVDAEINNARLSYRKTWGGLLSLAKIEAETEVSRNLENQKGQGRDFLNEVDVVYEALLRATLREATKKVREGEVPETPPRAGSTEQVREIFYNGRCSQKHRTSRFTREPYN